MSEQKKDYLYKGNINKEFLDFYGLEEQDVRAEFSARMQPPRFFVSNKTFEYLKKEGLLNKDGSIKEDQKETIQ